MTIQAPWLSIIMPVYNGEPFLRVALDSVVQQADPDIECIVVDDGSTDQSMAILAEYEGILPIVRLQKARTGNWVANTNAALDAARGAYACFLHQDDRWEPARLAIIRALAKSHPDVDLILCPSLFIDRDGQPLGRWTCPLPAYPRRVGFRQILARLLVQNFVAIPSPVFRTSAAREAGGLDESLWYTADWDFWLKLSTGSVIYLPEVLAAFRVHEGSQTVVRSHDTIEFKRQQDIVLERHFCKLAALDPDNDLVLRAARFSILVNTALAALHSGGRADLWSLAKASARLGPQGLCRYLRDSRIAERASARLKARHRARLPAAAM